MKVTFRVVGLYFGASNGVGQNPPKPDPFSGTDGEVVVDLPDGSKPTVFDVMKQVQADAAAGKIPNVLAFAFSPAAPSENDFIKEISVVYDKLPPMTSGSGSGPYTFKMTDDADATMSHELQYYIFKTNKSGQYVQLNNNNITRPFGGKPDDGAEIVNGTSVVWRQVTILNQANGSPRDYKFAMKAGGKPPKTMDVG